jgi:hypothetical protein
MGRWIRAYCSAPGSPAFFRVLAGRLPSWPAQRAAAAVLAISARRSGESFLNRALTIASACGFFFFAIALNVARKICSRKHSLLTCSRKHDKP